MYVVRSTREYPRGDAKGYPVFDASLMRSVIVRGDRIPQVMDGGNLTVNTAAGAYTVLPTDGTVIYTLATAGTNVYTLPAASAVPKGHEITFKKLLGTSVVRLTAAGSDVIDVAGTTTHDMTAAGRTVKIVSNGVDTWYIVQAVTPAAA